MGYPLLTTADDVEKLVSYLKTKPTGSEIKGVGTALGSRVIDGRKLSAYEKWGFIKREDNRVSLSEDGWALARGLVSTDDAFRRVIGNLKCYHAAVEFIQFQELSAISNVDIAALWHEQFSTEIGTTKENSLKDMAVCFFHVCQAAGFGTLVIGRRGSPTRLEVNRTEVSNYIGYEANPIPISDHGEGGIESTDLVSDDQFSSSSAKETNDHTGAVSTEENNANASRYQQGSFRVFIAHSSNEKIVGQIKDILELSDVSSEVAKEEETTAVPVPMKVLESMRKCNGAIIAVTADEKKRDSAGSFTLNENVLIEIGAAFVLYDTNVVLLWDRRLEVPSNLQGLYRCDFEGEMLDTVAFTKLMRALKKMRHERLLDKDPED